MIYADGLIPNLMSLPNRGHGTKFEIKLCFRTVKFVITCCDFKPESRNIVAREGDQ